PRAADRGQGLSDPRQMRDPPLAYAGGGPQERAARRHGEDGMSSDEKPVAGRFEDGKHFFDFMPARPEAGSAEPPPAPDGGDPALEERVVEALKTVRDPEIPINLVDLGLIYDLVVTRAGEVYVEMTLTTPSCPVAGALPGQVETAIGAVPGVASVRVNLVWTPPWSPDRMTEEARLELGLL